MGKGTLPIRRQGTGPRESEEFSWGIESNKNEIPPVISLINNESYLKLHSVLLNMPLDRELIVNPSLCWSRRWRSIRRCDHGCRKFDSSFYVQPIKSVYA